VKNSVSRIAKIIAGSHFSGVRDLLSYEEWLTIADNQRRCVFCGHLRLLHSDAAPQVCRVVGCGCPE